MFTVTIKTEKNTYQNSYFSPVLLSKAIADAGLTIQMPCGGRGTCGKCKVRAVGGLSPAAPEELQLLTAAQRASGLRLACCTCAEADCTIYFSTDRGKVQGVAEALAPAFKVDAGQDGYGVAVDIGTTTVAAYLYSLCDGVCHNSTCEENVQTAYGADVIARIEYANKGGLTELSDMIRKQISVMIGEKFAVAPKRLVVTGNTTMLHLLAGLDPRTLAVSPFTPVSHFGAWYGNLYLPRCISAYVGADMTCAVLSSGMQNDSSSLLVDIGTNGEMALWHGGKLVCCSTAAGPAFEGALISQGMSALPGAISRVWIEAGTVQYETVGEAEPIGICGSGLVDAVACMRKAGVLDETGYLENDYEIGDSKVRITAQDIRQLQLAKSAIRAGIETLMHTCGINAEQIDKFYIAGGFGKYLDAENAAKIGLFPQELVEKAVVLGNAAGAGASMILLSKQAQAESEQIAQEAQVTELSDSPVFMEKYMDYMMFETPL